ncbi:hypothetical protein NPIL_258951 [Nephila pilipes]|uniref:Uncharacterized protein n=1 Tax=Nephila pilipes TaxID=299642 RepID=A0A8X6QLJ9_NEPPI|nr:hypothetical protein NPIL_258951 [Nephila pilipes]
MSLRDIFSRPSNNSELSKNRQINYLKFLRQLDDSDFQPEGPELVKDFVPVIFERQNKFIIPYSFLNRNIFKFVKNVVLRYNRVLSEIIIEGIWVPEGYRFTTFKFECVDEIELLDEWESLCKFRHRDLRNTKSLFEFIYPPDISCYNELFNIKYYECISDKPKHLWTGHIRELMDSLKNLEITFRLSDMRLISIKNISHFNNVMKCFYGFGNSKRKLSQLLLPL